MKQDGILISAIQQATTNFTFLEIKPSMPDLVQHKHTSTMGAFHFCRIQPMHCSGAIWQALQKGSALHSAQNTVTNAIQYLQEKQPRTVIMIPTKQPEPRDSR